MSGHQPPPPPPNGPYGYPAAAPPQQPGPPPGPGAYPPYGQQPSPYGQPYPGQGPYGPVPPGGGWGGPPPGPPRRPRSPGQAASIAVVSLIAAFLVFRAVTAVNSGSGTPDTPPPDDPAGPVYTLTLPKTLLGGEYTLTEDHSDTLGRQIPRETAYERSLDVKAAFYTSRSGTEQLYYSGMSSAEPNPHYPEPGMLNGVGKNDDHEVVVERRTITPPGGGEDLLCEVHARTEGSRQVTVPVCSWVDEHTQGVVMDNSPATWATDPSDVDLDAFAEKVATIRDEVRERVE